jgi:hypothetical protein
MLPPCNTFGIKIELNFTSNEDYFHKVKFKTILIKTTLAFGKQEFTEIISFNWFHFKDTTLQL